MGDHYVLGSEPALRVSGVKSRALYKSPSDETINREVRSCVKVEVAVLGSPSLIVRTVSGDVKQH